MSADGTREALTWLLFDHSPYYAVGHLGCNCDQRAWEPKHVADAILASPWLAAHVAAAVAGRDAEIERLRFESEQARLAVIHAEEYARHTDTLVGIIRDSQERLARPGQRLADVKEILHRLPHAARQEREDRQLRDRDNTPLATRIAERADLEAEILRLRTLIEEEIETPAEAERDEARAALGAVAALADLWERGGRVAVDASSRRIYAKAGADLRAALAPVSGAVAKRHLITTPHDGHGANETCPTCPHVPVAKHEQEVATKAWDEGASATTQFWTRMVGWANQINPKRESAPEQPDNPYRTARTPGSDA